MRIWMVTTLSSCFLFACSSDFSIRPDGGSPPPITGGDGGADVQVPPPPGCDVTKLPKADACVVDESLGVFVSSSTGSDQNDGSRAKPLKSLLAAVALAKLSNRRVYACAEPYAEQVELAEGVPMFGYFACSQGWMVTSSHATVNAPASPAVAARDIKKPTRVEGFDFVAPDASAPGSSSVGMVAIASPGVHLVDVRLQAGKGAKGSDGQPAIQLSNAFSVNGDASNGGYTCKGTIACNVGPHASGGSNTCVGKNGISGGPGGDGGSPSLHVSVYDGVMWNWNANQAPTNGQAQPASAQTAQGGLVGGSENGKDGANGADGASGVTGADMGTFDPIKLYVPANGGDGTDGQPGQGGGGGAGKYPAVFYSASNYQGYYAWGYAGGGGGAGGCPGLAGSGGGGGGASVALLSFDSQLTIEASVLESKSGGDGGSASFASDPTSGGLGGASGANGSKGGNGGAGGRGGAGGNGAGGPSFAVASHGAPPLMLNATLKPGAGGAGVAQRTNGSGQTIPASPSGKAQATFAF